jgi:uncharacterized protein YjbI with pentapeptide repeats
MHWLDGLDEVMDAPTTNFVELAKIAGLNPAVAYVGMDLDGCDFSGCVLDGFNFTHCSLMRIKYDDATDFTGAIVDDAAISRRSRQRIKGLSADA